MNNTSEYQNIYANRKFKDSLFRMVFNAKEDLLDLYNAINGTSYTNTADLEINTLDNALYLTIKNDISFMIGCTINLYEHQSSYNPNMPLRGMVYFGQLFSKYTEQRKLNVFSSTLQKLPTPKFIVFYNGLKNEPDRKILKLSDAFQHEGGCLECEATMLNINYGKNHELMEKCRRLEEYSIFIATVRKYAVDRPAGLEFAISSAIDECIAKDVLKDVLIEQRGAIMNYVLEYFDKEMYERDLRENLREEIKAEIKEELQHAIRNEVEAEVRDKVKTEVEAEVRDKVKTEVEAEVRDKAKVEAICELINRMIERGKSFEEIADNIGESVESVKRMMK